ncbi:hypothetical protein FCR2A7T_20820 [Flavobacterium cauense R2A-7]|uniref:Uncharacterized protein n=1 Tax=Flavobacterium cauense R2A-7 TaxID=1341154 RepID=V6S2T8_9FLAO|nr:hypothetical protein FCR2A7T_20820 [Flavobacterium cauense R2A-7]KGO81842.1 hypothetical protein Q762_08355 [Flavobacterium cauense R2A-7]TWI13876.1 hypothetical protein IP98_01029 [Flavobacterium cauense R2A-7]
MNIFKKVNWKTFFIFFVVFTLMNGVVIPKFINNEEITVPRILISIVVSSIVSFILSLTVKPKSDSNE